MKPFPLSRRGLNWMLLGGLLLSGASSSLAADRYFDQNGVVAGYGLVKDAVYTWNTSGPVWNTSANGTGGVLSGWNNAANDVARFSLGETGVYGAITLSLAENITVGGINVGTNNLLKLDAASAMTLAFATNSIVTVTGGITSTGLTVGDNVNLSGDFTLVTTGSNGQLRFTGVGSDYEGTLTIKGAGNGGLTLDTATRFKDKTNIVLDSGRITMVGGSYTIARLSGSGGIIQASSGSTLVVKQSTDTQWSGQLGSGSGVSDSQSGLAKEGAGRLTLAGAVTPVTHYINSNLGVDIREGSLYVHGAISSNGSTANLTTTNTVKVSDSATFGGLVTTDKRLLLAAAGSIVDPGMFGQAGTMTLQQGMSGSSGATFHFDLNGDNGAGGLVNSLLRITGGVATLSGVKTVQFFDLGAGLIEAGVTYTLIDSSVALTSTDWTYDLGTTGWNVASFGVVNNQLQVVFAAIPEGNAVILVGLGILVAFAGTKLNRHKGCARA